MKDYILETNIQTRSLLIYTTRDLLKYYIYIIAGILLKNPEKYLTYCKKCLVEIENTSSKKREYALALMASNKIFIN